MATFYHLDSLTTAMCSDAPIICTKFKTKSTPSKESDYLTFSLQIQLYLRKSLCIFYNRIDKMLASGQDVVKRRGI